MGGHTHEHTVSMELPRIGVRGTARILADSLWSSAPRTFLFGGWQSSSNASHPSCFLAAGRRHDLILEFLRPSQCYQRPADDSDSGTIHWSDLRGDALATATTESASAL